jgi:hypothetical protein
LSQGSQPENWAPRQRSGRFAWLGAPFRFISPQIVEQPGTSLR